MLQRAHQLAVAGRAVYVMGANHQHALELEREFLRQYGQRCGVKFETTNINTFDWRTLRMRGAHTNCVVLIDHYAIESQLAGILEELHRYDAPEAQPMTRLRDAGGVVLALFAAWLWLAAMLSGCDSDRFCSQCMDACASRGIAACDSWATAKVCRCGAPMAEATP